MHVAQLWRYPVKSLAGQRVDRIDVDELGLRGDRQWGLVDLETGLVLTARRVPELLFAEPAVGAEPPVGDDSTAIRRVESMAIRLPDGRVTADDAELSAWLGRQVALRRPAPDERGWYEIAENDDRPEGDWIRWHGPKGVFHDSTRTRISIIGEDALGDWDVRRFRPNVVIAGGDERALVGHDVRIGSVAVRVAKEIDRCVIVTRPQPGIERDKSVLVRVHTERGGNLGVGALVRGPGTIAVGDAVEVVG